MLLVCVAKRFSDCGEGVQLPAARVESKVLLSTASSLRQRFCPRSRSREPVGSRGSCTPRLSSIVLFHSLNRMGGNKCCPTISPLIGLLILLPWRTKAAR